jgi:hypothetical protein
MFQVYFQMFHLFQTYVASILSGRCKSRSECCIYLQWFLNVFQAFSQVFQTLVSSVLFVFFYMLQLLYLNVSKVDRFVAHGMRVGSDWRCRGDVVDVQSGTSDVRGGAGRLLVRSLTNPTR